MVGDKTIIIPANTLLIPNHMAIQTYHRYWGPDCLEWRPSWWIGSTPSTDAGSVNSPLDDWLIISPHNGSFTASSKGIRNCPGKISSQVEFVATLTSLFRDLRVDPVQEWLQDIDMARKRVMRMAEEDTGQVLLLQMLHPEKAALAWRRR